MGRIENIDFCIRYLLEQNHTRRHVYKMLFMRFPEAFVVTTNVDGQFELAEFGIGYNTPGIIRLPFEQMEQRFPHTTLVRFNRDNPEPYIEDLPRFTAFIEEIVSILNQK